MRSGNYALNHLGIFRLDFLSIDVEGAELDVLGGLDLTLLAPEVILVENNRGLFSGRHIRNYLRKSGYFFHSRIWTCDDIFVRVH